MSEKKIFLIILNDILINFDFEINNFMNIKF